MKILLLGCNGQVGWELQRSLPPLGELVACDFDSPKDVRADFTDPRMVGAQVDRVRPDVIVNAAAYTAVDKAESEPDLAAMVNATTIGVIADRAHSIGASLVHFSTDYVFDGGDTGLRDETAPTGPLSVYGRTKLQGEELIRLSGCRHVILRTSWVYAARGHNFIKTMLRLAADRDSLNVINDQIGAPTGAEFLADATAQIITRLALGKGEEGTYHCVAAGETSWFDYARLVIEWARTNGLPVKIAPDAIKPIPTSAYPTPALRPLNSRLSTEKLQRVFGLSSPHWRTGVERVLREIAGR